MVKLEPHLAILLFYDVNFTAKIPDLNSVFFQKIVSLVYTFAGPFDLRSYLINCSLKKNGTAYLSLIFTPQSLLTILGLEGGGVLPPNLWEALMQKLFESLIYNFLTIPKYVYTLTLKKNVICTLTSVLRGVSNWQVKICCAYFGHIYIFFLSIIRILSC